MSGQSLGRLTAVLQGDSPVPARHSQDSPRVLWRLR